MSSSFTKTPASPSCYKVFVIYGSSMLLPCQVFRRLVHNIFKRCFWIARRVKTMRKLTSAKAARIKRLLGNGIILEEIARKVGVSTSTVFMLSQPPRYKQRSNQRRASYVANTMFSGLLNSHMERLRLEGHVLAGRLDVSRETMSLWRHGENMPGQAHLDVLLQELGVSYESLPPQVRAYYDTKRLRAELGGPANLAAYRMYPTPPTSLPRD